ncbi:MAG: hypothetical protein HQL49_04880 [Gammaproteobacteria bacterium]|nr:hypothetical protein [Gammaproteobacteria bacterium]
MLRIARIALLLTLLGAPFALLAVGLGDVRLYSYLNQRLHAEIDLIAVKPGEIGSLTASLASYETFERVGIDRPSLLSKLTFDLHERSDGKPIIKVTSSELIHTPFLDFIVELTWRSGRVLRQYTLLLDPIELAPQQNVTLKSATTTQAPQPQAKAKVASPVAAAAKTGREPRILGEKLSYGPVMQGDTLWKIAMELRPSEDIPVKDVLEALFAQNPNAFIEGDINRLMQGVVLKLDSIPVAVNARQSGGTAKEVTAAPRPVADKTPPPATTPAATATTSEAKLALVTPKSAETQATGGSATTAKGGTDARLRQELMLALELSESQKRENELLKKRMAELQQQIDRLNQLISVNDGGLARLQQQLQAQGDVTAIPAVESAVTPVAVPVSAVADVVLKSEATVALTASTPAMTTETTEVVFPEVAPEISSGATTEMASMPPVEAPELQPATPPAPVESAPIANLVDDNWPMPEPSLLTQVEQFVLAVVALIVSDPLFLGLAVVILLLPLVLILLIRRRRNRDAAIPATSSMVAAASAQAEASSFMSDLSLSGLQEGNARPEEAEIDPITEADVYIAYGRFQQAEELLKDSIEQHPQNSDYKFKLLELYSTTKKGREFEALVDIHQDSLRASAHWQRIVAMGRQIAPKSILFSGTEVVDTHVTESAPESASWVNEPETVSAADVMDIGIDLDELSQEMESDATGEDLGIDLGFDLNDLEDDLDKLTAGISSDDINLTPVAEPVKSEPARSDKAQVVAASEAATELDEEWQLTAPVAEEPSAAVDVAMDELAEELALSDAAVTPETPETPEMPETQAVAAVEEEDFNLDLDLDFAETAVTAEGDIDRDITAPAVKDHSDTSADTPASADEITFELDEFDSETVKTPAPAVTPPATTASSSAEIDFDLDFDIDLDALEPEAEAEKAPAPAAVSKAVESVATEPKGDSKNEAISDDFDDLFSDLEQLGGDVDLSDGEIDDITFDIPDELNGEDNAMATKIDLARAYIEMGDKDAARHMLQEVVEEGSTEQQQQAQQILEQI